MEGVQTKTEFWSNVKDKHDKDANQLINTSHF